MFIGFLTFVVATAQIVESFLRFLSVLADF